jgi:DNA-directed RNA polymerase specialized sigma24 family protein
MSRKELAQQYKVTLKTIDRRISKALTVIRTELDRHP